MGNIVLSSSAGTHSHTSNTTEQTVFTITPTQINTIKGVWLDLSNITQNCVIRVKYKIDGTNYRTEQTIGLQSEDITDNPAVFIDDEYTIDDDFQVTFQSNTVEGSSKNIPYEYFYEGLGTDTTAWTYTLTSTADGSPIADAEIWVTTDSGGTNIIASGTTNASGQVTFYFAQSQTIYVWRQKSGWSFTNPDSETT